MIKAEVVAGKLDRILLAIYLIALCGLLMYPIAGPQVRLLSIGSDKWMHAALFGGLAMLLRWNLSANRAALIVSIGVAFCVAAATEIAQGLVAYRSADLRDLLAGLIGATLGAVSMSAFVSFVVLQKRIGLLVATLGLMVATFFGLADVTGVGKSSQFGALQMTGMGLGALIAAGGVGAYLMAQHVDRRD